MTPSQHARERNNVPVEPGVVEILFLGDGLLVEFVVVRVDQFGVLQTFILRNEAITDDLNLRLVRDGLEIGVEDTAFCVEGLAVAVAASSRVETASQLGLGTWGEIGLRLDANDMVVV